MKPIRAWLLVAATCVFIAAPALAGVGVRNAVILPSSDGVLYSKFPAGDNPLPPPYVALAWSNGGELDAAGLDNLHHGTPWTYDVRQFLSGTNAATAPITLIQVSGSNAASSGFTAPGTGQNLNFSSTSDTNKSGVFALFADDGVPMTGSTATSASQAWALFATIPPPPDTSPRRLLFEGDFESGRVNASNFFTGGRYKDAWNVHEYLPLTTFTVTNISKANPAVMSWTGTDPAVYEGVALGVISSGMTQISRRLVKCQPTGYDASANTCRLYQDGNDAGIYNSADTVCRAAATASCTPVNTSGYSTWSGTTTGTTFFRDETRNGGLDPSSPNFTKVVQSAVPVSNINGSANLVTPLKGNYFLQIRLDFWRNHSTFDSINEYKNKPRTNVYTGEESHTWNRINSGEEFCMSVGVFLPSNYEHKDTTNFSFGSNEHINFPVPKDNVTMFNIRTVGQDGPSGVDHWWIDLNNNGPRVHIDLGSVVGDIDKWTVFTLKIKPSHTNTGYAKVWKSTGPYLSGSSKQRSDTLVMNRQNAPVGVSTAAYYQFHIRQYQHSWHHHAEYMASRDSWVGFDEYRLTRFVADGGNCSDVHPFRVNLN